MRAYLNKFAETFKNAAATLITESIGREELQFKSTWERDLVHHVLFCNNLIKSTIRPELQLADVRKKVFSKIRCCSYFNKNLFQD